MGTAIAMAEANRMKISLSNIGKRYRYEWIFRAIDYEFLTGQAYAILGANGSGKSTLMKVLSGHLTPSKGEITFENNNQLVEKDEVYRSISYAAPYIELIEELSLEETLQFHARFKPFYSGLNSKLLIELLGMQSSKDKEVRYFSSGMKQRLKLVMAMCTDTPIVLLDEPTTNLDRQGMDWYLGLVEKYTKNRLVIVASNMEEDYGYCQHQLNILDFKKKKEKKKN